MTLPKQPSLSGSDLGSQSDPSGSGGEAAAPPTSPLEVGDVVAEKYRVEELLAVGGMGSVLRARHLTLGHDVALKVLRPEKADVAQAVPRFLREARAAAAIRSDHVVRIHDVGTLDSGLPFMVLELLDGSDVRALLKERGTFSVAEAADCVYQAADGLAEAHRLGVVHRDLKPSNLFAVPRRSGRPLIKVLDFGVSKIERTGVDDEPDLTTTRTLVGSPSYMSPEQVKDSRSVDPTSDIWSLGVILQQLLTGKTPFRRASAGETYAAILSAPHPRLHHFRKDVPMELQAVVDRCLEKDPAQRYPSMEALLAALEPFVSDAEPGGRVSGEQPAAPRAPAPSRPEPSEAPPPPSIPPAPPRVSQAPADPEIEAAILTSIARDLAKQGIPGEVRLSGDEARLLGSGSRIAAPLGLLAREWQSLAPEVRERRTAAVAQRLASEYRVKSKRAKPPSALAQALTVLAVLALAGLAVWAAWQYLGPAVLR